MKREPVLLAMSILAALQFFFGGMGATGIGQDNTILIAIAAYGTLATAAAQIGVQFYVRGQVTSNEAVVAQLTPTGGVVAGPASAAPTGDPVVVLSHEPGM